MTNKISMYLFADAERFNKTIYGKGIKPFRSSGTIFYITDTIVSADTIFQSNGIPKEFQKIILKIGIGSLALMNLVENVGVHVQEYTTGVILDALSMSDGGQRRVYGEYELTNRRIVFFCTQQNSFSCDIKGHPYGEVKDFFGSITQEGYLDAYINSMFEILGFNEIYSPKNGTLMGPIRKKLQNM